jgi:hypothetical protein
VFTLELDCGEARNEPRPLSWWCPHPEGSSLPGSGVSRFLPGRVWEHQTQWLMPAILATLEMQKIEVQDQPRQKVHETHPPTPHLNQWLAPVIPATQEHKQKDCSPGQAGQKARPYLENNQSETGWGHGSSSRVPA